VLAVVIMIAITFDSTTPANVANAFSAFCGLSFSCFLSGLIRCFPASCDDCRAKTVWRDAGT
jgi:hypothetical protein